MPSDASELPTLRITAEHLKDGRYIGPDLSDWAGDIELDITAREQVRHLSESMRIAGSAFDRALCDIQRAAEDLHLNGAGYRDLEVTLRGIRADLDDLRSDVLAPALRRMDTLNESLGRAA